MDTLKHLLILTEKINISIIVHFAPSGTVEKKNFYNKSGRVV